MKKTIILEKRWTETLDKFEERINSKSGYEAISIVHNSISYAVLMKRIA
jgi:hypothetical protein